MKEISLNDKVRKYVASKHTAIVDEDGEKVDNINEIENYIKQLNNSDKDSIVRKFLSKLQRDFAQEVMDEIEEALKTNIKDAESRFDVKIDMDNDDYELYDKLEQEFQNDVFKELSFD